MSPNPNPAHISAPLWRFTERVLALEPHDFVYSGTYGLKSGYHSSVSDNLTWWPGNYSVRLPADLVSINRQYGRALDIKSRQAAAGAAPTIMAKYGARMKAAAKARDPRVRKWREVLGQFDTDSPPEAIDFQTLVERQPDDTHVWHFHWSILTLYVNDPEAYDAMYSVLIGQSFADYNATLPGGNPFMALSDAQQADMYRRICNIDSFEYYGNVLGGAAIPNAVIGGVTVPSTPYALTVKLDQTLAAVMALRQVVDTLAAVIQAGGGSVDTAAILAGVDDRLAVLAQEQRDAVADLGEGGAAQVRADQ